MKEKDNIILLQGEELKNNIWPKSFPVWVAAFYVSLFIVRPWEKLFPWMGAIHFERLYLIFMILVLLVTEKKKIIITPFLVSILFFLCSLFFSYIFAYNRAVSWDRLYIFLIQIIFYIYLISVIRSPHELLFVVIVYIATITAYLYKSEWEFFVHGTHRYDMGVIRLVGIESMFGGPNAVAVTVNASLPFGHFLWKCRKTITNSWPVFYRKWFPRFIVFYFILCFSSIALTNSRSGMAGMVLFIVISGLRGGSFKNKVKYVFIALCLISVIWICLPEKNQARVRTIWAPETGPANAQSSADGRIEGLKVGLEIFKRNPLFGVGVGNYKGYRVDHIDGVYLQAHNLIGQLLAETGLLGSFSFVLMVIIVYLNSKKVNRISKQNKDPSLLFYKEFADACKISLIVLLFLSLFGHFYLRYNWFWVGIFSSLLVVFSESKLFIINKTNDNNRNITKN